MPQLDAVQAKILGRCVRRFADELRDGLLALVREHMRGYEPRELLELLEELALVARQLAVAGPEVTVHDVHARLLERVLLSQRRGDEYVALLPNADAEAAVRSMRDFQRRLAALELPGIEATPTVSIGVCPVPPDCVLTEREVLGRANEAKNQAKAHGKARIASYEGTLYRPSDIRVAEV